ncbi:MAG: dicarboxylate/amino acid:cation symporter [Bacteroidetes bacterium]|nr:dicarboxylate/amino acid:cation symporter [Bacteroidota bacterium]
MKEKKDTSKPLQSLYFHLQALIEGKLYVKVLIGLFAGVAFGIIIGPETGFVKPETSQILGNWFALPGNIFIRMVQMIMIPLVVSSIIFGIAGGENKDSLKTVGPMAGIYFMGTTIISIIVGVALALTVKPGNFIDASFLTNMPVVESVEENGTGSIANVPKLLSQILPDNPLRSMMTGEMLSIVIFAIIVGLALNSLKSKSSAPVLDLLFSVQEICMAVTRWAMILAPFAVFGLIGQITAQVGINALAGLGIYILTVIAGLLIIFMLNLLIINFFTNTRPAKFLASVKDLLLLAFSMASSAAVMPLSMKTVEEKFGVSKEISRFIIPIGATINMNGTALYQAVATIFLAQVFGLELNLLSIILIIVTTVAASIGTPSSPGAGIIILATVLSSVGIPIEAIALVMGVDHILGMSRTAINVTGDVAACLVFDKIQKEKLKEVPVVVAVG